MLNVLRTTGKRTKTIWWVLIIVTVVTFLGGFVFLVGSGLDSSNRARASGAVGTVDGEPVSRIDYQNAMLDQREAYKRQYNMEPAERDAKMLDAQAWRSVIVQNLLQKQARDLGLGATDQEVVVSLKTNPPQAVLASPSFQTDGKFDPAKYQEAMLNPANVNDVVALEELTRRQLPMRKLQERLMASVKVAEPEVLRDYQARFERLDATVVVVPGATAGNVPAPSEADLDRTYQKHGTRFSTGPRTRLEVLLVPKKLGDEEVRTARELAQSLAERVRRGEDFAALARDYSEGPGADQGGVIDRVFALQEFGPEMGAKIGALPPGGVTDAVQDGGRFFVFKLIEQTIGADGGPGYKVAQIVVKVRPDAEDLREQHASLVKVRNQAAKVGLGKAATAAGMATAMTGFFDVQNAPPELFNAPEATDWGLAARKSEVSPVFEGIDEFVVVQVADQRPAGIPAREEILPQIRQIAEMEARIAMAKPTSDAIAAALSRGQTLEQAARAAGMTATKVQSMSRLQPDPSVAGSPELVGRMFAANVGQVVGPIETLGGWMFARVDQKYPADPTLLDQVRSSITQDMLQRRQQAFLNGLMADLRNKAKVKDLRNEGMY